MQWGGGQTYLNSPIHILCYNTSDLLGSHRRKNKNLLLLLREDIPPEAQSLDICLGALIGLMLLEKLNETIEKNVNSFLKLYIRIYFYFQIACGFYKDI